jgi:hypothetical protein
MAPSSKLTDFQMATLIELYTNPETKYSLKALHQQTIDWNNEVSPRTIERLLRSAGAVRNHRRQFDEALNKRIVHLFFVEALPDEIIYECLQAEGWKLSWTAFVHTRIHHCVIKRRFSAAEIRGLKDDWRLIVSQELDKGSIGSYGRELLYTHFRYSSGLRLLVPRYVPCVK